MGQGFSLTTLSAGSAGIDIPELSDLVYEKDGVVLVKVVIKPYAMDLKKYRKKIIRERKALADVPNALAYQRIAETETNGYVVRQYIYSSIYDRMSTRPFLEDIEKKWLAFQLLCAVRDCHARDVFHGDIKTENTLVTSWNWLYLSDFSSSFKPTTLPEDNPADFSYYFDTAGRRTCYLAPERFLATGETPDPKAPITWAMDVFSVGCVIAELFLETPIFTLSQLYQYRRGDFLHQYMGVITDPSSGRTPISGSSANLGEADERIDRIYYDFDKISYFLGYENEKPTPAAKSLSTGTSLQPIPVHLNIPNNEHFASALDRRPVDDGTLIFLTLVVSSMRHTARATARVRACDILLAFAERLTDEAKLDRVLPYVMTLLTDKSELVKVTAIRTVTQLLALVKVVSPINAHVFPEYILPRMQIFLPGSPTEPSPLVRATYAACLGSLATSASKFLDMVATLRSDGSLPTTDPDADDAISGDAPFQGLFDTARAELIEVFEGHTKALITDNDSAVKRAFLGSVPELCGASLEEFILPLMVQALTDPEDFVVRSVLHSFADMAQLGLFQRSKIWEMVDVVSRFTMHPNIWIREAAANFISSATIFLSSADKLCIILPLIRPYLKTGLDDYSELAVLDALKKPLSRAVLDMSINWAIKSDRGIFWKAVHQLRTFSFNSGSFVPNISPKETGHHALQRIPKNEEDEQWLSKLRNIGMSQDDEAKLLALREYIWRLAPSKAREVMFDEQITEEPPRKINNGLEGSGEQYSIAEALLDASMTIDDSIAKRKLSAMNSHKSKIGLPIATNELEPNSPNLSPALLSPTDASTSTTRKESLVRPGSADTTGQMSDDSSAMTLMSRKESGKGPPETGTTSTNAFGKVEGPFSQFTSQSLPITLARDRNGAAKDEIRFRAAHTYSGNDPNILKMLDAMYVDNYPNDIAEFGPMIAPSSRRRAISRNSNQAADKPWRPEGTLVATFAEHIGPIHHIAVAPDHVFFLTGGDDGCVKVWDTGRLERNIAHRSRQTHKHANNTKVTALCFVEHTHTFVSCGSDGSINVVKVDCIQSGGVGRYGKLRILREYQLSKNEFAIWAEHFKLDTNSVLLIATNRSRVLAIDLRAMTILYTLVNPVHHGTPTCFCIDKKRSWLLLGTSHGVLDLWDLRFKVRLKAWGVPGATSIYRIRIHPTRGRGRWVCVAGGSGQGEITVWDVEKTQCREVYRAGSSREASKNYEPWPVDEDRPEGMLGRFAEALGPTANVSNYGIRAMITGTDAHDDNRDVKYGFVITGGSDRKIRFWDLSRVESSMVFTSHTNTTTLNNERVPRQTPTAPNVGTRDRGKGGGKADGGSKGSGKAPRSTVISLQGQKLLRAHLDSILDVALLESPYGNDG
ncbi:hypothetical protein DID88_003144 [Monilinia fructigena]|uniref:non-specific serine/threonine protein kinase n=1 Tax=Monilinia fructigena TaxID=38457 RepID=A0A395IVA1_9HELO|nr:hypothetical protein DID88_003144 [Monilinia fructigena]